jgi:hypothetical protein
VRQHPGAWPEPLGGPDVSEATPVGGSILDGVVDSVISRLRGGDALTEQTLDRFEALIRQFVQFAERGHGVTDLREVTGAVVEAYVRAPTSDGADPSLSLQHFRRSGVRVLYRTCRQLGMDVGTRLLMWCCLLGIRGGSGRWLMQRWRSRAPRRLRRSATLVRLLHGRCVRRPPGRVSCRGCGGNTLILLVRVCGLRARRGRCRGGGT